MVDYESLDDHQLIQRVSQVDKDALEALYVRYRTPVYSLAMFMLKQPALAEEATQDIFSEHLAEGLQFQLGARPAKGLDYERGPPQDRGRYPVSPADNH